MPKTARKQSPQHYGRRKLRDLGLLADSSLPAISVQVVERIRVNRKRTAAGSYLLVDDAGRVFVLPEAVASSESMVRRNSAWLVGLYGAGQRFAVPSVYDIEDDILERLKT